MSQVFMWTVCGLFAALAGGLTGLVGWEAYRIRTGAWSPPPRRWRFLLAMAAFVDSTSCLGVATLLVSVAASPGARTVLEGIMAVAGLAFGASVLACLYIGYPWLFQRRW
jgi:hypothetical protein